MRTSRSWFWLVLFLGAQLTSGIANAQSVEEQPELPKPVEPLPSETLTPPPQPKSLPAHRTVKKGSPAPKQQAVRADRGEGALPSDRSFNAKKTPP
jgi:hypothetical protein